ncbi:MAG: ArsR/SmtB family transcription factor [Desulfocapsaceae bacterium]
MDLEHAAGRCAELGNITRLSIFRLLVKAGKQGLPVGKIQSSLGIPGSTLTHHIQRLVRVGLVKQRRQSRILHCEPQMTAVRELGEYLLSECCSIQQNFSTDDSDQRIKI